MQVQVCTGKEAGADIMASVIISGATSAIASSVAREFAMKKYDVILLARNIDECKKIESDISIRYGVKASSYQFDAKDTVSHKDLMQKIRRENPQILGLFMAQGFMPPNDSVKISAEDIDAASKINFESIVSLSTAFYEGCKGYEFISAISSIAGIRGKKRNLVYNAAKSACITYLEGLRQSAMEKNISVTDIRPGFVDTRMTLGMKLPMKASPESVARTIVKGIKRRNKVIYAPFFWGYIMLIIRHLPGFIYDRLKF